VDARGGEHRRRQRLDPGRRVLGGVAGQRVPDRLGQQPVPPEPGARPPVQGGRRAGPVLAGQPDPQGVGEQVVVAVPGPLVVERHEEQVGPLQLLEHPLAAVADRRCMGVRGQQGVAQRGAQPVEHGGGQQEAPGRGG
jgi:hypothetical protein